MPDESSLIELIVAKDGEADRIIECRTGTVIGRDTACDIQLVDPTQGVSRRHARIRVNADGLVLIEDLDSRNGIWAGRHRVRSKILTSEVDVAVGPFRLRLSPGQKTPSIAIAGHEEYDAEAERTLNISVADPSGPPTIERRQLLLLQRVIAELSSESDAGSVEAAACKLLVEDLGAIAARIVMVGERWPPGIRAEAVAASSAAAPDHRLSRTLIDRVESERRPMLATPGLKHAESIPVSICSNAQVTAFVAAPLSRQSDERRLLYLTIDADRLYPHLASFVGVLAAQIGLAADAAERTSALREQAIRAHEGKLARQIQEQLVPPTSLRLGPLGIDTYYQPCREVGGDYCDAWSLPDGRVACVIADVSGKGFPAAMIMANFHAAVRSVLDYEPNLAAAFDRIRSQLARMLSVGSFLTVVCLSIDPVTRRYELLNAGHPTPLLVGADGQCAWMEQAGNGPLGFEQRPWDIAHGQFHDGERVLLVTDGITERMDSQRRMFGLDGVRRWAEMQNWSRLLTDDDRPPRALARRCELFSGGGEPDDDQTVMQVIVGSIAPGDGL
jgi:sigma-B regulation protein RsbU (phosphoserine phosphatase)